MRNKVGYDLVLKINSIDYHIEIKGTATTKKNFILTRNEYVKGIENKKILIAFLQNCKSLKSKVIMTMFQQTNAKWKSVIFDGKDWIRDDRFEVEITPFQFQGKVKEL